MLLEIVSVWVHAHTEIVVMGAMSPLFIRVALGVWRIFRAPRAQKVAEAISATSHPSAGFGEPFPAYRSRSAPLGSRAQR